MPMNADKTKNENKMVSCVDGRSPAASADFFPASGGRGGGHSRRLRRRLVSGNSLRVLAAAVLLAGVAAGQSAPTIVNSSFPPGAVGTLYAQGLSVSGGTAPYTWSLTAGSLPPGLTVYSFGTISGVPTSSGTYQFTLTVTDARGLIASANLSITIAGPAFSITTTSLPSGIVGQNYSPATLTAAGGTAPLTWAVSAGLPPGLGISQAGVISGTPTAAGVYPFTVQATDATGKSASANLSISITTSPLTITTIPPLFTGTVGQPYAQAFSASGGKPPYNWTVSGSLPAGLNLSSTNGTVTGTPTTAGASNFTLQVTDSASATAQQNFSITVNPPALTLLVVSSVPSGTVGVSYSQTLPVQASGGTPPYTWSASGSVPGLVFQSAAPVALSGTPTSSGTFNLTVQVADSAGLTANKTLAVTIAAGALGITTARQLPDGALNTPYTQTIAATGGVPPYTWSATGLPAGLVVNSSTGVIGGTPSAAGSFGVAITVQDSTLSQFSDRFTLNVDFPAAPGVTLSGLPNPAAPATQYPIGVTFAGPYPADITGQLLLTFSPNSGPGDQTIQFASGGTTASFTVPAGGTATLSSVPLALQTGTVAGTLTISLRLQAGGVDITPSPAPSISTQIAAAAPVITSVKSSVSGSTLSIVVTGYATSRTMTQAVFAFSAVAGQTLQTTASSITVDVSSLFGGWFQGTASAQFGTQFIFTQPFTIQGDATAVAPVSVTLVNSLGQATGKF
jgi:large repetitive protein